MYFVVLAFCSRFKPKLLQSQSTKQKRLILLRDKIKINKTNGITFVATTNDALVTISMAHNRRVLIAIFHSFHRIKWGKIIIQMNYVQITRRRRLFALLATVSFWTQIQSIFDFVDKIQPKKKILSCDFFFLRHFYCSSFSPSARLTAWCNCCFPHLAIIYRFCVTATVFLTDSIPIRFLSTPLSTKCGRSFETKSNLFVFMEIHCIFWL